MNLNQLHGLKTWHLRHGRQRPVEHRAWEGVLTLWLLGWAGMPAALLSDTAWLAPCCAMLAALPAAYVALRRRLHRSGRLRCDWLAALR